MGAYYMATINKTMYDTHSLNNGCKLMEHSYIMNDYCIAVLSLLHENPQPLVWLCDYHEEDERCPIDWAQCTEESINLGTFYPIIINHNTREYIDLGRWILEDFWIHPVPILCNSDETAMGGGDYHEDSSIRGVWCGHTISSHEELPKEYKDFIEVTDKYDFGQG